MLRERWEPRKSDRSSIASTSSNSKKSGPQAGFQQQQKVWSPSMAPSNSKSLVAKHGFQQQQKILVAKHGFQQQLKSGRQAGFQQQQQQQVWSPSRLPVTATSLAAKQASSNRRPVSMLNLTEMRGFVQFPGFSLSYIAESFFLSVVA